MARILSIDYGLKRCGIAVTDPLQIIAQPLTSVKREEIESYIVDYMELEAVETIVFGEPRHDDGSPSQLQPHIDGLRRRLQKRYPHLRLDLQDEAYTSVEAARIIRTMNKHKKRPSKDVDVISAVLILQRYLGHID